MSIEYRLRERSVDGIWEIAWSDPETGKPRRKTTSTRDKIEADKKLAEMILSGDTVPPEVVTIGYLLDRYFQHIKRRKERNTIVPMRSKVDRMTAAIGDIRWQDFSQADVERYIDHARTLTRWGQGKQPLSDGTIAKDLEVLRSALRHGHAHKIVSHPTTIEIRDLQSEHRYTWMTREQFNAVLARIEDDPEREHIYGFLLVALATGGRKEAVFDLTWDRVYIPEPVLEQIRPEVEPSLGFFSSVPVGSVPTPPEDGPAVFPKRVPRTLRAVKNAAFDLDKLAHVRGAYIDLGEGRGNKPRPKIPIGQNWRLMVYLMFGGDRDQPYVISYRGQKIRTGVKRGLEAVGKEAKLPFKLTHHVLKRTAITWMVRAGMDFTLIRELTNTTEDTLRKHYNHHRPDLEGALGDILSV